METIKSRLEDVHGHKETHKPPKNIMKNRKITEMENEEIKKELRENQRICLNDSDSERLEQLCTMDGGEQKQNSAPTTEEEKENHQQRNDISKL